MRHAHLLAGATLFAHAAWGPCAAAQERLHLQEIPDSALDPLGLRVRSEGWPASGPRLRGGGGLSLGRALGRGSEPALLAPSATFGAGTMTKGHDVVVAKADASLPVEGSRDDLGRLEAFARARAAARVGPSLRGPGVDLEIEGASLHAGDGSLWTLRRDVGSRAFHDAHLTAAVAPSLGRGDRVTLALPVRLSLRRLAYDGGSMAAQGVSSGLALRGRNEAVPRFELELVGASVQRLALEAPAPSLRRLDRLDVRIGHLEAAAELDDTWLAARGFVAFTSARGDAGSDARGVTFAAAATVHRRWRSEGAPLSSLRGSLGVARDYGPAVDAGGIADLSARMRGEADVRAEGDGGGAAARIAAESLDLVRGGDRGVRVALASELFIGTHGVTFGIFHLASGQCPAAPCHRIGLFLRYEGRNADDAPAPLPDRGPSLPPPPSPPAQKPRAPDAPPKSRRNEVYEFDPNDVVTP